MLHNVKDTFFNGKITVTAGTLLNVLIPARKGLFPVLTELWYTGTGTAHTVTVMEPQGRTTLSAAAAGSQAVINLTEDPGSIAANDWLALEDDAGTTSLHKVSSVATLAVTLTANVTATKKGAKVWFFGVAADTNNALRALLQAASAQTKFQSQLAGFGSAGPGDPMLLQSNNATNAGTFDVVAAAYCQG